MPPFRVSPSRVVLVALLLALGAFSFFIPLPSTQGRGGAAPTPEPIETVVVTRTTVPQKTPPPTPPPTPRVLTIASGADSGFFSGLTNLVGSIRVWCPECKIAVFNLGMDPHQLEIVRNWCNVTLEWENGMPRVDGQVLQAKQYAWKPMAILHAVITHKDVMWLDAGCSLSGPVMSTFGKIIMETGHFTVQGQDTDSSRWCHQGTLSAFGKTKADMKDKPSFAGGVVGFTFESPAYWDILLPWVHCASRRHCIAPDGASLGDHRFDQCVLTILSYSAKVNVTPHTELLAYASSQLKPCFQASEMVIWTARQGESCYASRAHVNCVPANTTQPKGHP